MSEAGADFLVRVIVYAAETVELGDEEVAFTIPVEAFEHYQDWISRVCQTVGITRYRFLDEASAAALGYGLTLRGDAAYMVFDFGGGTLDVSVVRVDPGARGTRRCTVLGKSGVDVGGTTIDQWLYRDVLELNHVAPEDVRHLSGLLLLEVERVKEALSSVERDEIVVADPRTGEVLTAAYSRSRFDDILEQNGLFETIETTVHRALADARERGYDREHIEAVLLIGGSSLIPSVRRAVRQMFGPRVKTHQPLDAVVRGAAAFVAGIDFADHIQHEYALRYYNREKGEHEYFTLVPAGTPYPSHGPIAQVLVKASYDDQEFLGLEIYEIGKKDGLLRGEGPILDLVFDPSGAVRFRKREDANVLSKFWINEKFPTFIHAQPKAKRSERRFPVQFSIDGRKYLCVTVRDTLTGKTLMENHPVIKLI